MGEQPFKKAKAFTDVGNIESMSKERWSAAKWVRGQPRIYCVNDVEPETEPAFGIPILAQREGVVSYVSHNEFLKMLDKAWYEKEDLGQCHGSFEVHSHPVEHQNIPLCSSGQ